MTVPSSPLHVYQRTVNGDMEDSLSIIATLIEPGQSVLDVGMGSGGLGQFLSQRGPIVADGVTLSQVEADIAKVWYRTIHVQDLDVADLPILFSGERYDTIVCADVLEHLKAPERVLGQCKLLLKPGGRLIISVPNVGYCGLVAELLQGEFRYRAEGLLDKTHLRFFTRKSLERFLGDWGWHICFVATTSRSLTASEFSVEFDSLPPAVSRFLLAMPDAAVYQFVAVVQPDQLLSSQSSSDSRDNASLRPSHLPVRALFSAEVFLGLNGNYSQGSKVVVAGTIGQAKQTIKFDIPASVQPYTGIRLDPADRPGFFRLHQVRLLLADGQLVWTWGVEESEVNLLKSMPHQDILFQQHWELIDGVLLFLFGDDPWLELPIPSQALVMMSETGGSLEVVSGWPMSADYLAASVATRELKVNFQKSASDREANFKKIALAQQENLSKIVLAHQDEMKSVSQKLQVNMLTLNQLESSNLALQQDKLELERELNASKSQVRREQVQFQQLQGHLQTIEQSTVFRVTRPLVHFKMKLDRLLGRTDQNTNAFEVQTQRMNVQVESPVCVDVIVPVYRGLADTQRCVTSVLHSKCDTAYRLVILNDCSPEPEVTQWLRTIAATDSRIQLLENTENLGFVGTVNRGMALGDSNDVLLLNSDAEVANNWLDRLQRAAYSLPNVASVTPFSNNATICSYPQFCHSNELPDGFNTAKLDELFSHYLTGQTLPIPTGVGFCMYIRRACLLEIGVFDEVNFGKGYGEENDFCVRATNAGWINLHALDTFVRHAGGVSFGESKSTREQQAILTIRRLHPTYEPTVHDFVKRDPASNARLTIDLARITTAGKPVILNVTHNREGGTLRHILELAENLRNVAVFFRLWPVPSGVRVALEGGDEAFQMFFEIPQEQDQLVSALRTLQVSHIHYHHLLGHAPDIETLPKRLGVSYDFTAHDYFSYCPQISLTDHTDRYCGEEGLEQCRACLQRHPAPGGVTIDEWRMRHAKFLRHSRYLIAPSVDTAIRMQSFVPSAYVRVVPHTNLLAKVLVYPKPNPQPINGTRPLKIAVLGALSKLKGADILESVAIMAAIKSVPIEFHLIGYAYRNLCTQPKALLTVHGAYDDPDLPKILSWLQPDIAWFPAVAPETFSYTLSACLEAGLPVVAPNIGSFAERLQGRPWSWVCDWRQESDAWVNFFDSLRTRHFLTSSPPELPCAAANDRKMFDDAFGYHREYLAALPIPKPPQPAELTASLEAWQPVRIQNTIHLKSSALRAITRLRATAFLSPLARIVPMHMQRRVKTWLGK